MGNERMLAAKYDALKMALNERTRRLWAGTEAVAWGRGGIAAVRRVTGLPRNTIVRGIREMTQANPLHAGRLRAPGGGRKAKMAHSQPSRWTPIHTEAYRRRRNWWAISRMAAGPYGGVSPNGVPRAIRRRFAFTTFWTRSWARRSRTASTIWHAGAGWVSVGVDHDTAAFAVNTIHRWWRTMGRAAYPRATALQIVADTLRSARRPSAYASVLDQAAKKAR